MDLGLKDKVALVAAASKGLGKAVAFELAREGAHVAICARGQSALLATAEELRANTGVRVLALSADMASTVDIQRLAEAVQAEFGRVDILVNNSGGPRAGVFTDMADQDWLDALELNLMSAIRLTQAVLPGMRQRRWGRIINITSAGVKQPLPTLILSNTARVGVVAMAKTLAGQVAAEGITVNTVCPSYLWTDRVQSLAETTAAREGRTVEVVISGWEAAIPAHRLGQPEELAAMVAFLASERAAFITGTTIQVDGGYVASLL